MKNEKNFVKEYNDNYFNYKYKINVLHTLKNFLILVLIVSISIGFVKIVNGYLERDSFHSISRKSTNTLSEKNRVLNNAYAILNNINDQNMVLSADNLNLAKKYGEVIDPEDREAAASMRNLPVPITMDEEVKPLDESDKSMAYKIYEKLRGRYEVFHTALYNLANTDPVQIVRQYHYNGYSIIGKYNPNEKSHIKGKRHTYFIKNFTNANIKFIDGDGNVLSEDSNLKDIMAMASVYTFYHNPYDANTFLKYCYKLFDSSYSFVASISEVYYCSGCVHYDDEEYLASQATDPYKVSYDKIKSVHTTQKVLDKDIPYKAGVLHRIDTSNLYVNNQSYEEFVSNIKNGIKNNDNNYCPGHIDINLCVTLLTFDASYGLIDIDREYGNRGLYFTEKWHGWEVPKILKVRELLYKDWEKEYGIDVFFKKEVEPLTQEEINYYMSRLSPELSENRRKVIEVALRSVGRIPYYYGGKSNRAGYEVNNFGGKILSDYKGRVLKGLDCSGWVNWVYHTAFNKAIIKTEGTQKLAIEGDKIQRKNLLPGDIIVRPGIDSHVMMFLEWGENGKVKVIHENGGVDNVSIGTFEAYYPYYRRILNT